MLRFDLALLWCFEVCVDERKWSTVFRQAPNEGIKKLPGPFPGVQDQRAYVRVVVNACACVQKRGANLSDYIKRLAALPLT